MLKIIKSKQPARENQKKERKKKREKMEWWILSQARPHIYSNYCLEINKWERGGWEEIRCVNVFFLLCFKRCLTLQMVFIMRLLRWPCILRLPTPQTWHHHFETCSPILSRRITSTDTEHYLRMSPQCTVNARWHVILISSTAIEVSSLRHRGPFFEARRGYRDHCTVTQIEEMKGRKKNINGIDLQSSLSCR